MITTPMPSMSNWQPKPVSAKLSALAGLLAGLRQGVTGIQQSHAADAARAKADDQQQFENAIAIEQLKNARGAAARAAATSEAELANKNADNTRALIQPLEQAAIGAPVARNLGAAIYDRANPLKLDAAAAQAAKPLVKESPTAMFSGEGTGTRETTVGGVPMQMRTPDPIPFNYQAAGSAGTQRLAASDAAKAQDAQTEASAGIELGKRYQAAMSALPSDRPLQASDVQRFNTLWRQVEDPTLQAAAKRTFQPPQEIQDYMKTQQTIAARPPVDPSSQAYKDALLQQMQDRNAPIDIAPDVETTETGRKYVDLGKYTVQERAKVRDAAHSQGAAIVTPALSNKLKDIDTARMNQRDLMADISSTLPKDASGRTLEYPNIMLSKAFQSDEARAAYGAWRTTAISTLKAMVGGQGSGLRINQAEIAAALENDIPQLTDTLPVAIRKFASITKQLNNVENGILGTPAAPSGAAKPPANPKLGDLWQSPSGPRKWNGQSWGM